MTKMLYIHIDADAFFASVEQCLHRELRGKPIVTGRDGSIGVALSYEAKALGVQRALPIHLVRKQFPTVQMVVSDYYMYKVYSDRMIRIIQEHIPQISRKSIDECSANISDLCKTIEEAESLSSEIQNELEQKLLCTFSFGISTSPLLAKMASGMNKPHGITSIDPAKDREYYKKTISAVPGLGWKISHKLFEMRIMTIGSFIEFYPGVQKHFSIVTDDIHHQLLGGTPLRIDQHNLQKSMNKSRSFKVSENYSEVFGQLVVNFEHLMRKLRAEDFTCKSIHVGIKNADGHHQGESLLLPMHTRDTALIMEHVQILFSDLFDGKRGCRYVSLTFSGLRPNGGVQEDFFSEHEVHQGSEELFEAVDDINQKFGEAIVTLASTLSRPKRLGSHIDPKKNPITLRHKLLPYETENRRVKYPYLGKVD